MLADCGNNAHGKYSDMPNIQIEVSALNNESHFSEEYTYIVPINILVMVILILSLGMSTLKMIKEFKLGESFEQPLTFLMFAILTELILIILDLLKFLQYHVDGT